MMQPSMSYINQYKKLDLFVTMYQKRKRYLEQFSICQKSTKQQKPMHQIVVSQHRNGDFPCEICNVNPCTLRNNTCTWSMKATIPLIKTKHAGSFLLSSTVNNQPDTILTVFIIFNRLTNLRLASLLTYATLFFFK